MKKSYRVTLVVAALLAATSLVRWSGERFGPQSLDHSTLNPNALQARSMPDAPVLGLPMGISVTDSILIIIDPYSDRAVQILSRVDGSRLAALGPRGEGPGEMVGAWSADVIGGNHPAVRVLDINLQRLSVFDLSTYRLREVVSVEGLGTITDHAELPGGTIAAIGSFEGGRIAFLTPSGLLQRFGGSIPEAIGEVPLPVLLHAYQAYLEPSPDRQKLVIVTRHAGWLEIYTSDGELRTRVSGPFEFEPKFTVGQGLDGPVMRMARELRFGYMDVATTDSRIFALFSGRLNGVFGSEAVYGRHVHVFDWEGNLVEVLELSGDTFAIAVDENGSQMYAIEHLPEPRILVYDLTRPLAG